MLKQSAILLAGLTAVQALGQHQCIHFPSSEATTDRSGLTDKGPQIVFAQTQDSHLVGTDHDFLLVSTDDQLHKHGIPVLTSSKDNVAVHLAVANWITDIEKVSGLRLEVYNDTLPRSSKSAVIVGTSGSDIVHDLKGYQGVRDDLEGTWESFDIRVLRDPGRDLDHAVVISGSDRRGTVFALYDLSEQMGVSPWHYWSDSPPIPRHSIAFNTSTHCSHGEPSVKYRGLFINDELPVLWNWARDQFGVPSPEPPFQVGMYEKVFEFVLRMKGNYFWPAMWSSMFSVDGMNVTSGLPSEPLTGPNQVLADSMGIVMGTSHHEPMGRNKEEWDQGGSGPWDWTNKDTMKEWWKYGAERAKGVETMFTMGMRGDGDSGLNGASKELLEEITDAQREILKEVYDTDDASTITQMWAMYKEVQGYFADGLKVPEDVTILFADDNYGNLMSVKPWDMDHKGGAGIYYHADYVGHPRDYRWMNTNSYAKMWEQLNVAYSFNTTEIWILNVGSMKFLEVPIEWFLNMAWDKERWSRNTHQDFLALLAEREFGAEHAEDIGDILGRYSKLAGLMKHELLSPTTYSVINYHEVERNIANWTSLEERATKILSQIPKEKKSAYIELVWMPVSLVTNLNKLHAAVRRNNVYAHQARTSANAEGKKAIEHFEQDFNLSRIFNELEDGKWDHMLDMPHIGYPDNHWHTPQRNSLPPISYIHPGEPSRLGREGIARGQLSNLRFTIENSYGSFPGTNPDNCPKKFDCPPPKVYTMDRYGASSRWVEIASGGPANVTWTTSSNASYLHIEPSSGEIKGDGSTDTRCYITVDWDKVPAADGDKPYYEPEGAITFTTSDGTNVSIFAPVVNYPAIANDFHGFVEGDGYVVMEPVHAQHKKAVDGYAYEELVDFGRGLSGVEMFPVTNENFTIGQGPSLHYDFFAHGDSYDQNKFEVTVQIAPSLNFILGKQIAFGLQFDDREPEIITPVPTDRVPNQGDIGSVPIDWEPTVIQDVRNVTMTVEMEDGKVRGEHSLTIWGMSAGIVLERIWVDMGGIKERGYSLLGPPESQRV